MNYKTVNGVSFKKTNAIEFFLSNINKNINYRDYNDKVLKLVKLLLDDSIKAIPPLSEKHTYIIRKRYGVYDNGKSQTIDVISEEVGITKQRVSQILEASQFFLLSYVFRNNEDKISSLELSEHYDELKNISISQLGVERMFLLNFTKNNIYTLGDLLTRSKYDLFNIFTCKKSECINGIINEVHLLNLKFIDELNEEERDYLIKKSEKKRILNSSSWFIDRNDFFNGVRKKEKNSFCLNTVESVLNYVNSQDCKVDVKIIDWLYNNGFAIDENLILKNCISSKENIKSHRIDKFNFTIAELLEIKTMDLDLSDRTRNALIRNGLDTLDKIIQLNFRDLESLKSLGEKSKDEIISIIHDLGLFFKNEQSYMKYYTNIIYDELCNEKKYIKK